MPKFDYKAVDAKGIFKSGSVTVKNKQEVVKYLSSQGLVPVSLKEKKKFRHRKLKSNRAWLLTFTEYLSNLLNAKVELIKALYIIAESYDDEHSIELIHRIADKIKKGSSFSDALKDEGIFDELYITLVKVGEEGGNLGYSVGKLYEHLKEKNETYSFLISSIIYPSVLLGTTMLSAFVLLVYVLPKFGQIFDELQQEIPFFTALLINIGNFLKNYLVFIIIGMVAIGFILKKNRKLHERLLHYFHKMPLMGDIIFALDIRNFFQSMAILLQGGNPFLNAFTLSRKVVKRQDLQQSLNRMLNQIKQGKSFSQLLRAEGIFPSDVINLVAISEETGQSAEIFTNISNHLDKKNKQKITKLLNIFEPITIIIMGLFIGAIVLSMLSAIFGINDVKF